MIKIQLDKNNTKIKVEIRIRMIINNEIRRMITSIYIVNQHKNKYKNKTMNDDDNRN